MDTKQKHIKSIDEKYMKMSLADEFIMFMRNSNNVISSKRGDFDRLPYIGIFYLPIEIARRVKFFADYKKCEVEGMKRCKVIDTIDAHHMRFAYYDDFNDNIVVCEIYKDDYYLEGNILKEINYGSTRL